MTRPDRDRLTGLWLALLMIFALTGDAGGPADGPHPVLWGPLTLHGLSLWALAWLLVRLAGRLHRWLAAIVLALISLFLALEALAAHLIGLHLNSLTIGLLTTPGGGGHTPVTVAVPLLLLAGVAAAAIWLTARQGCRRVRWLIALAVASGMTVQGLHAVWFHQGDPRAVTLRRAAPVLITPHPWHLKILTGPILGPWGDNPFALGRIDPPGPAMPPESLPALSGDRNLLLVVVDSLRGDSLAPDSGHMPGLMELARAGSLNTRHWSAANCTHFSLFTLLTGRLPTAFSRARAHPAPGRLARALSASGYRISTAEAFSLDWYDTIDVTLGQPDQRHVATKDSRAAREKSVTAATRRAIESAAATGTPFFHLAYYMGPHFPYLGDAPAALKDPVGRYQAALRETDREISGLIKGLQADGLLDDTVVVITGDHGEALMESGVIGHASQLTAAQLQVPLLVLGADVPGHVKSHRDLAPWMLAALQDAPPDKVADPPHWPVILSGCAYDYPASFAVLTARDRADFDQWQGTLLPRPRPDGTLAPSAFQRRAARQLLDAIRRAEKD